MLNFCDFIQVYVFTTNHHLNNMNIYWSLQDYINNTCIAVQVNMDKIVSGRRYIYLAS